MADTAAEKSDGTEKKSSKKRKSKKDAEIEKLRTELENARKEVREIKELLQRIQADFDNYRKRIRRENELREKYGCEELIKRMLDVLDTLERALAHEEGRFKEGLEAIKQQIESVLSEFGVQSFHSAGEKFDPNFHEAIATGEGEDGIILEEYQKGYTLYDKVIRHAKVKVAKR